MTALNRLLRRACLYPVAWCLTVHSATGQAPSPAEYLASVTTLLEAQWPENRTVTIVCHGHSVPAGYFATPTVDSRRAYPNLLRERLARQHPHAVINIIVTALGDEDSAQGAARFDADVMRLKPDVVMLDYALNDRRIGLAKAKVHWEDMIQRARSAGARVILFTPTPDQRATLSDPDDPLNLHAAQVRQLAAQHRVALVDSLAAFARETGNGTPLSALMAQSNHPNERGHALVATELFPWFQDQNQNRTMIDQPVRSNP